VRLLHPGRFCGTRQKLAHPVRAGNWEQGTRRPRQADLKLLMIAKKNPKALLVASLRREGRKRPVCPARPRTMEAQVSDYVWEVKEIVN
jgi:hypothetical protein